MRYKYRVRYANNIVTFFEYEKSLSNNYHTFKSQLINRMEEIGYNYTYLDIRKLNHYIFENKTHNRISMEEMTDNQLYDFLDLFEKTIQQQISIFDNDKANKDIMKVLKSNMQSKKDNLIDLINANLVGNCFFITLTYNNDNVLFLEDLAESNKNFTEFIKKFNAYLFGRTEKNTIIKNLKYVCRWELQKENERNALHYHMIVFDIQFARFSKDQLNMLRTIWGKGSVNVKAISKNTSGVGKYMAKYLALDWEDFVSNKKSYFSSKNLLRPFNAYVIDYDKDNNVLTLDNGIVVNLNDYNIEKIENFESFFNGKTKKIIYNKG